MEDKSTIHQKCTDLEKRLNTRFKAYNLLAYVFVFIMFAIVATGFGLALYPFKTLDVKQPIQILNTNKEVCAGQYLEYKFEYKKFTNKPALVSKQLVNDYIITFDDYTSNVPIGEGIVLNRTGVKIPENAPTGRYKLRIAFTYHINPFSTQVVRVESEYFTVKNMIVNKDNKNNIKQLIKIVEENKQMLKIVKERQDARIEREKKQGLIK
jgi:hypothetical protein